VIHMVFELHPFGDRKIGHPRLSRRSARPFLGLPNPANRRI
jgi:hypothetical protein